MNEELLEEVTAVIKANKHRRAGPPRRRTRRNTKYRSGLGKAFDFHISLALRERGAGKLWR